MARERQRSQIAAGALRAGDRATGPRPIGLLPVLCVVVLVAAAIPRGSTEETPAIGATPAGVTITSAAQLAEARSEAAQGNFHRARELCQQLLEHDPADAEARSELAKVEAIIGGRSDVRVLDTTLEPLRQQAALGESRMALARAELMIQGERFEDADGILTAARANLLPYSSEAVIRAEIQRMETLIQTCRDHGRQEADVNARTQRHHDRHEAEARTRGEAEQQRSRFHELLARIRGLAAREHYELALAKCRRLLTDYPGEPEAEKFFTQLIAKVHEQRRLSLLDRDRELRQELNERIERSMLPTGFDGRPIYPTDWLSRHGEGGALDAPTRLPAWQEALQERLVERISFAFDAMNAVDVLNALARQTNLNLIIDPTVSAAGERLISLKANNITLENALSWVCRLADTRWHLSKGAIYIGGEDELQPILAVYDLGDLLFQGRDFPGRTLSFATAGGGGAAATNLFGNAKEAAPAVTPEELVDLIQKSVSPLTWAKPEYGITVRGTTLMVTAPPATHLLLQQFIRAQSKMKNVLVQADVRWLTLQDGYLEEIGVNWTAAGSLLTLPNGRTTGYHRLSGDFDHSGTLINNLPAPAVTIQPATAGTGLTLSGVLLTFRQLSWILTAVERNEKGTILQAPTVTTLNGVEGNCFFGNQLAYIADYDIVNYTFDPKIEILNLGASLSIKPFVSSDGKYVSMEMNPATAGLQSLYTENLTAPRFAITGTVMWYLGMFIYPLELPLVQIRELRTNVMIPDGGTVLVGGFGAHIEQQMSAKIPFLGHIPFLGRLFGKRGRYSDRSQLYLLTTVHIINYEELEAKL